MVIIKKNRKRARTCIIGQKIEQCALISFPRFQNSIKISKHNTYHFWFVFFPLMFQRLLFFVIFYVAISSPFSHFIPLSNFNYSAMSFICYPSRPPSLISSRCLARLQLWYHRHHQGRTTLDIISYTTTLISTHSIIKWKLFY